MGLGLREVIFDGDGDAAHIHEVITAEFPVLELCGCYSLLRLGANSRDLVGIEGPDSDLMVTFLKDIVRQAKLYVRPPQCDITENDIKPTITSLKVIFTLICEYVHILFITFCTCVYICVPSACNSLSCMFAMLP